MQGRSAELQALGVKAHPTQQQIEELAIGSRQMLGNAVADLLAKTAAEAKPKAPKPLGMLDSVACKVQARVLLAPLKASRFNSEN